MATSIYTLSPYIVLPQLPPTSGKVKQALRIVASEFAVRTSAWRETLSATLALDDTSAALQTVLNDALPASGATAVIRKVVKITIDDGTDYRKVLYPKQYELDDDGLLTWDTYEPDSGDILSIDVVVQPTLDTYNYPDNFMEKWKKAIIDGAIAYLASQDGEPWYSEKTAAKHEREYERAVRRAIVGKSHKSHRFFRFKPPTLVSPEIAGTPLSWGGNYEPEAE